MKKIIFYYWKYSKIPKVPSSENYIAELHFNCSPMSRWLKSSSRKVYYLKKQGEETTKENRKKQLDYEEELSQGALNDGMYILPNVTNDVVRKFHFLQLSFFTQTMCRRASLAIES